MRNKPCHGMYVMHGWCDLTITLKVPWCYQQ